MTRLTLPAALAAASIACGGKTRGGTVASAGPAPVTAPAPRPPRWVVGDAAPRDSAPPLASDPVVPPLYAYAAGLMPLASAGLPQFRLRHPTYDGRGVVIGILDSGIDPGVAGLALTSEGAPKILDLRDFSGEGVVPLIPVRPAPDGTVTVAGHVLAGAGRIARITGAATWYAGELRELPLGRRTPTSSRSSSSRRPTAGSRSSTPT